MLNNSYTYIGLDNTNQHLLVKGKWERRYGNNVECTISTSTSTPTREPYLQAPLPEVQRQHSAIRCSRPAFDCSMVSCTVVRFHGHLYLKYEHALSKQHFPEANVRDWILVPVVVCARTKLEFRIHPVGSC